jgi:hypothetical protein
MALIELTPNVVLGTLAAIVSAKVAWEFLFSPLKVFPGPFLSRYTDGWRAYLATLGDVDRKHLKWHRQWGTAVRVGPSTISLSDPELIKVIYTSKNAWRKVNIPQPARVSSLRCVELTFEGQSDMYRVNDVVLDGKRIQNIFNTQDKAFHTKYSKPLGGLWTLSKVLDFEPLIDETLRELVQKLNEEYVDKNAVCMIDDWISYCKSIIESSETLTDRSSYMGCHGQCQLG